MPGKASVKKPGKGKGKTTKAPAKKRDRPKNEPKSATQPNENGNKPGKRKSSEVEMVFRILAVKKMLLEGYHRQEILQFVTENWGNKERQANIYLAKARDEIKGEMESGGLINIEWHIASRVNLYNRTLQLDDNATALRVIDSLHKIAPMDGGGTRITFEEDHENLGVGEKAPHQGEDSGEGEPPRLETVETVPVETTTAGIKPKLETREIMETQEIPRAPRL